jgi:hypothetical protein
VGVSLTNTAVDLARAKNPKIKRNTRMFRQRIRSARGGGEPQQALIFAQAPEISDF